MTKEVDLLQHRGTKTHTPPSDLLCDSRDLIPVAAFQIEKNFTRQVVREREINGENIFGGLFSLLTEILSDQLPRSRERQNVIFCTC